jgi:hypothetical protein
LPQLITLYDSVARPIAKLHPATDWAEVTFGPHKEGDDKDAFPLWSPGVVPVGEGRLNEAVQYVSAWVADLDKMTAAEVQATLDTVRMFGIRFAAYTTHTHMQPDPKAKGAIGPKWRLVIPYAVPIAVDAHAHVWLALAALFAPKLDPQCKDCSRQYYIPSCRVGAERELIELDPTCPLFDVSPIAESAPDPEAERPKAHLNLTRALTDAQRAAAVDAIANYYPEQGRNELALALGGAFAIEGVRTEDIEFCVGYGAAAGGALEPNKHANSAVYSAINRADGDDTKGWPTVAEHLGEHGAAALQAAIRKPTLRVDTSALPGATPIQVQVKNTANAWAKSTDPEKTAASAVLKNALHGIPVSAEEATLAATALLREHPTTDTVALGALLTAPEAVAAAGERVVAQVQRAAKEAADFRELQLQKAFGSDRVTPYTDEEVQALADGVGVPLAQLRTALVLQHNSTGQSYVLKHNGRYVACAPVSLAATAQQFLCPFDENDLEEKSTSELVREFGRTVEHVEGSLLLDRDKLDTGNNTLTQAMCPPRKLEPTYCEEVEAWLMLLGGERYPDLLNWLAQCPDLSKPLAALVLSPTGGAGKSLLAVAISRIWTTQGPTPMNIALGNFNARMARCPLVFADEKLPETSSGRVRTAELRELIQQQGFVLNEKHRPTMNIHGCVRVVIAANNTEWLEQTGRTATKDDLSAIADRFLVVETTDAPGSFLEAIGGRPHIQSEWLDKDALARHVLWIAETHRVQHAKPVRFGVGASKKVVKRISMASGARARVASWIVMALIEKDLASARKSLHVEGDRIRLNSNELIRNWKTIPSDEQVPPAGLLRKALKELSCAVEAVNGVPNHWISLEDLSEFAQEQDICTLDTLLQKAGTYDRSDKIHSLQQAA